jgi:hypothetical protein
VGSRTAALGRPAVAACLALSVLAATAVAFAQPSGKIARIGVMVPQ